MIWAGGYDSSALTDETVTSIPPSRARWPRVRLPHDWRAVRRRRFRRPRRRDRPPAVRPRGSPVSAPRTDRAHSRPASRRLPRRGRPRACVTAWRPPAPRSRVRPPQRAASPSTGRESASAALVSGFSAVHEAVSSRPPTSIVRSVMWDLSHAVVLKLTTMYIHYIPNIVNIANRRNTRRGESIVVSGIRAAATFNSCNDHLLISLAKQYRESKLADAYLPVWAIL